MSRSFKISTNYQYAAVPQEQLNLPNSEDGNHCSDMNYHEIDVLDSSDEDDTDSISDAQLWREKVNQHRGRREKRKCFNCLCFVLFCISIVAILTALYMLGYLHPWKTASASFCSSRSCVLAAAAIANSLDVNVDPCENFFEFACGGWKSLNPIPPGRSYYDAFDKQERWVKKALKRLLEENCLNCSKSSSEYKTKLVYKTCNDIRAINGYGSLPLQNLIDQFGGWSVSGNWNQSNFSLNRLYKDVFRYSAVIFVKIVVDADLLNSSRNIIRVTPGGLSLSSETYYFGKTLEDLTLRAHHTFMTNIAVLLGGERNASSRLMADVLQFEITLANIQIPEDETEAAEEYHYVTFEELQNISPSFNWTDIILSSFADAGIFELTKIIATSYTGYLRKLSDVVKNTSTETLNNYMIWHLAKNFMAGIGKDYTDIKRQLDRDIFGDDAASCHERWKWCVSYVENNLGLSIGRLFVERHFDLKNRKMADGMVKQIKDAFKRNLPKATWLDEETAKTAYTKVSAVKDAVGFPDSILNKAQMDLDFSKLNVTDEMTFFDINVQLSRFAFKNSLKDLLTPVNDDVWSMNPTDLNAYYSPASNEIVLPAGVLQPPAYKSDYPQSINFGGIGFVVGHELTHGFDNSGRKYDSFGNLHDWWKEDTAKKFLEKSQCMAKQYSKYDMFGIPMDGNRTLAENIADNGGLRLAYHAYMNWRKTTDGGNDPLLPSLKYTHEQLFFISFGQVWCASDTLQHAEQFLVKSAHSPNSIRVLGSVMNMHEFSDAFHCKIGSTMNPKEKCVVW